MENTEQYLQHLLKLTCEMAGAMKAIGTDDLPALAESIVRQEVHASSLVALRRGVIAGALAKEQGAAIGRAGAELVRTSQQFAALLKHSSQNVAIFFALCETHTGERKEARGFRQKNQTWSCEI